MTDTPPSIGHKNPGPGCEYCYACGEWSSGYLWQFEMTATKASEYAGRVQCPVCAAWTECKPKP